MNKKPETEREAVEAMGVKIEETNVQQTFAPPEEARLRPGENPFAGIITDKDYPDGKPNQIPPATEPVRPPHLTGEYPEEEEAIQIVRKPERKKVLKKPLRRDFNGEDFSFHDIADHFEEHIDLSIPGYCDLHELVVRLARYFVAPHTQVIDIGASTGSLLANIKNNLEGVSNTDYIAIEPERNFSESIDRYGLKHIAQRFEEVDESYFRNVSLATMLFTMQFVPFTKRPKLLKRIAQNLPPEGAFIIAEKTYAESGQIQHIIDMAYYAFKSQAFSLEQIVGKERALETIMRPVTESHLMYMLDEAGFTAVTPFWRNLNFGAWICRRK